ncbi:RDD family protein [Flammeovirga sp. SJP92]|uniref:RDD family protein n=1 Tax=Flammeovirga sp. SJP92 TaxID=1775430 RepID=UPI0007996964|nr:RDD family protein [Flammeovirga sp. SJP92]KXX69118.1 hypothetical protein AVL50_16910 [Flammeovirga sp. SJP92]
MKKSIFDYTEEKYLTRYRRDPYGNREAYQELWEYPVKIETIPKVKRHLHNSIDYAFFTIVISLFTLPYFFMWGEHSLIEEYGIKTSLIENCLLVIRHYFFFYLFSFPILYIISEIFFGKTLSQYLFSTQLINENLERPTNKSIILRNVIKIFSLEQFFPDRDKSGYHWYEKYSNTYLVEKEEIERLKKIMLENEKEI